MDFLKIKSFQQNSGCRRWSTRMHKWRKQNKWDGSVKNILMKVTSWWIGRIFMLGWEYIKVIDLLFHVARRKFGAFKFWGTPYLKTPYPRCFCFLDGYSFHALFPWVYCCGGCFTFTRLLGLGSLSWSCEEFVLKNSPFAQGQVVSIMTWKFQILYHLSMSWNFLASKLCVCGSLPH